MRWPVFLFVAGVLPACGALDTAPLSGRILDSATRQPVARARVTLIRLQTVAGVPPSQLWENDTTPATEQRPDGAAFTTVTAEDGRFDFVTTAPAIFALTISRPGYTIAGDEPLQVSVDAKRPGERITVLLDPEASLSGRVIDAETRAPVGGLWIRALRWKTAAGSHFLLPALSTAVTKESGEYSLTGLQAGEYLLAVQPALGRAFVNVEKGDKPLGERPKTYPCTYYPGVETATQAAPIYAYPGAALTGIDFKLSKRAAAGVRVKISTNLDNEVGDVALTLSSTEFQGAARSTSVIAKGRAKPGEMLALDGLVPGPYALFASGDRRPGIPVRAALLEFEVSQGDRILLEPALTQGTPVFGKFRAEKAEVAEVLSGAAIRVSFFPIGHLPMENEVLPEAIVNPGDGTFRADGFLSGRYRVVVSELPAGVGVHRIIHKAGAGQGRIVDLAPGGPSPQMDIVLAPATAALTVKVSDGGDPVRGANVILAMEPYDAREAQLSGKAMQSDGEGRCTFLGLVAGVYRVVAFPGELPWRTSSGFAGRLTMATEYEVREGSTQAVEIELSPDRSPH